MRKLKFKLLVVLFLLTNIIYAQQWLTTPEVFRRQSKTSFIKGINDGSIAIDLKSKVAKTWVVYSDRDNNKLYNQAGGGANGTTLSFMDPLYVTEVKDNWLRVYGAQKQEFVGWIEAKYLLLSIYSLKTEGNTKEDDVSIARKAIILSSLDDINKDDIPDLDKQKNFYYQPEPKQGTEKGSPSAFRIFFVMKEQGGSVLLAETDVLNGSIFTNKGKVFGWIPRANITDWPSRVALEPSRSEEAMKHYSDKTLQGYVDLSKLKKGLDDNIWSKNAEAEFRVGPIRANRMRMPIFEAEAVNGNENIKRVVTIATNAADSESSVEQDEKNKATLEMLIKKSSMTNIVFAIDATSSMRPYSSAVASSINKIIKENARLNQHKLQFGLIVYRDYADGVDAYAVTLLSTDFDKIREKVNSIQFFSKDSDLPEAQYNGLIKGIEKMGFDKEQSNVIVLIGDCGNHDPDKLKIDAVVDVLHKNNINLISYQVANFPDKDDSYFTFNLDAQNYIQLTAKKIKGSTTGVKIKWDKVEGNCYKLRMTEKKDDFENMFGRFIYANPDNPMTPTYLEQSIVETLTEYMFAVDKNILVLKDAGVKNLSGVDGEKASEGLILFIMNSYSMTRLQALDFLSKTEVTKKVYTAIDYTSSGYPALVPVVFLSENEKINLVKALTKLTSGSNCVTTTQKRICLKDNLIEICKSILGPTTSTEAIQEYTMQQVWKLIIGIDFEDKKLGKVRLSEIPDIDDTDFANFNKKFELKAKEFCNKTYEHSDPYKSRRFLLYGSYFYWIPLTDFPGTN